MVAMHSLAKGKVCFFTEEENPRVFLSRKGFVYSSAWKMVAYVHYLTTGTLNLLPMAFLNIERMYVLRKRDIFANNFA